MADMEAKLVGRIAQGPFETVGRSESWAEQRTTSVLVVGKYSDLKNKVKPGDSMKSFPSWFDGKADENWFVKTVELTSPDGVTGELRLSLINCPEGKTFPYNVTWDIAMEEVQMKLINHPSVLHNCDVDALIAWLDTQPGLRVYKDKDEIKYRYLKYEKQGETFSYVEKNITGDWNIAFCNAVTQGIDTYNKYLPVVTKNSYYLELPGVAYNDAHVITGGLLTGFTGPDSIGRFNEPPIGIRGYSSGNGLWFKNCDKFTSQPDGTWVRTEGWVFTNDPSHKWIYTGSLD